MIPYGRQEITQEDIDAVNEVLKSDFLTQGPAVPRFEELVADYCGASHGVASNSATSALHIACLALGLGREDWLWTSPVTFVASANCALYCGASVDFVDIDPDTYVMSANKLEAKLEWAEKENRLPKIVIPVHLSGQSCEMKKIALLSRKYGFRVIEDASHCIGARFSGEPVGNCKYSDICVFSFHPVKIITTAEGGLATTNSDALAARMRMFRSHGTTRDTEKMTSQSHGPWYYQQLELGFNYRLTDIQAALGISQLNRLDAYVERRQEHAAAYDRELANLPLKLPTVPQSCYSARHLYIVRLHLERIGSTHREVFENLRSDGIGVNLHYIPIHLQPYYERMGFKPGDFPDAEAYYREAISIPMFSRMTVVQRDRVVYSLMQRLQ